MSKNSKHERVQVEWDDSTTLSGWNTKDSLDRKPTDLRCISVGWLVSQSKDRIVVSSSATSDFEAFNTPMSIPRSAIRRMRKVR